MERLLMLGSQYPKLGEIGQKTLAPAIATISAGSDPNSPSFVYKGDKSGCPNEDGLLILRQDQRWLLAVADGHLGHEASHELLQGLAQIPNIPARLGQLSLALASGDWLETAVGGTALLIACLDATTGSVFGLSFGDASLLTLGANGPRLHNPLQQNFLRGGGPLMVETGTPFQFTVAPGEMLLMHTDGINECCYREPERSIQMRHLAELYTNHPSPQAFSTALAELALAGVDGNYGGQDNIAMIAFATAPA